MTCRAGLDRPTGPDLIRPATEGRRAWVGWTERSRSSRAPEAASAKGSRRSSCRRARASCSATSAAIASVRRSTSSQQLGEIHGLAGDVTDDGFCQALVDAAVERFGGLDVSVANAGIVHRHPFLEDEASFISGESVIIDGAQLAEQR